MLKIAPPPHVAVMTYEHEMKRNELAAIALVQSHTRVPVPDVEAGFTELDLPAPGDPTAFMRGYGHADLTGSEPIRRRLYTLYLILIMIIETKYRGHQDTTQYNRAGERLTEMMARFGRTR